MATRAPVTGATGLMEFDCGYKATKGAAGLDRITTIEAAVTTRCPCSREISARDAQNQRGVVSFAVRTQGFIWFEKLIEAIEACASCALYSVLKREDEEWVTERAYDNPRFVDDLREVALVLRGDDRVTWYEISVENQEAIHVHNAYSSVERSKCGQ